MQLKLMDGSVVEISDEMYITIRPTDHFREPTLLRQISGCSGVSEIGWHPTPGWRWFAALQYCYDGVHRGLLYNGLRMSDVTIFNTHPLNYEKSVSPSPTDENFR